MKKTELQSLEEESLIEFPCNFPLKVMGAAIPEFHQCIIDIAHKHDPYFDADEIKMRNSKTGKYASLTLNIHAKNKPQLNALYQELTNCELVLWAL
jgi:putative lipoic acid-binding regulatory protein